MGCRYEEATGGSPRRASSPRPVVQNHSRKPGGCAFSAQTHTQKINRMKNVLILLLLVFAACTQTPVQYEKTNPAAEMQKKNSETALKLFEYFNRHQWKEMAALYSSSAEFRDPSLGVKPVMQTHAQIVEKYSTLQSAFADIHDEVKAIYPSGEKQVIVEFISTGTAPDGSKFELPVCTVFTMENGMIVRDNTYYDNTRE
jgi:ketosteroid isomerase-like protein